MRSRLCDLLFTYKRNEVLIYLITPRPDPRLDEPDEEVEKKHVHKFIDLNGICDGALWSANVFGATIELGFIFWTQCNCNWMLV